MPKLFTDEQIEQARNVRLENYLRFYESNNITVNEHYDEIRLKDHDSFVLTISNDIFHWGSQHIGGKGAIDYLIKVRDYDFKQAVSMLLPNGSIDLTYPSAAYKPRPQKSVERKVFELPPKSDSTNSTVKYLQSRGIDSDIINECIENGSIYQTMFYSEKAKRSFPNSVFVGYDHSENGEKKTKFACIRSTFGSYKMDITGSNKAYNFLLPAGFSAHKSADAVSVFESPIDVLSGATLAKKKYGERYKNIHRLSLGGISDLALKNFLQTFPDVYTVNLCLDNDEAGRKASKDISKMLSELSKTNGKVYKVNVLPPKQGKDYNEMLLAELNDCGTKSKEAR